MSGSKIRKFRKLVRAGSSPELAKVMNSGEFRQRHFQRALTHCEHQEGDMKNYIPPRGFFNKGPAHYAAQKKMSNDLIEMSQIVDDLDLNVDVTVDDDSTTVI